MEILIYGIVGDPCDMPDTGYLTQVIASASEDLTVRINSLGGLVFDGLAIYNALVQSPRRVTCVIDGIAGSIASIIAMAGDEIVMAESAMLMIHNPSDASWGEADDLRQAADRLDKIKDQLIGIYGKRTGIDADQLSAMLDAETWLNAQEALDLGFVTSIAAPSRMVAQCDASTLGLRHVPDHPLIAKAKSAPTAAAVVIPPNPENTMPDGTEAAATTTANTDTSHLAAGAASALAIAAATAGAPVNQADVSALIAAERARASTIRNEVSRARLSREFADQLVDEGVTVDAARTRIIDHIATNAPTITNMAPATIPVAQFQARADAMSAAIAHRANPRNQLTEDARAFAGRRLIVLARDFLESTGVNARNMGDVEVAQAVFRYRGPSNAGQHTTSDFPSLMANTVGRTLRRGYELAPRTFTGFCRQASVPDFRPVSRVALSDISKMSQVLESAEYQYATVGDSAEQYTVGKWGQIISLSWETIINDDLQAFDRLPMAMGQEAAQVEGDVVYAILLSNPAMADGVTLFHANHGNLAGAGSTISIASLQAGRTAMRTQKAPKGRFTAATPSSLIVGPLKEQEANQFTSANYVATKNGDINPDYNRQLTPVVEPRINDVSWFLAADPNAQAIDTIEYAYLAGHEGVQIEQRQGFEVDGVDIKARLVFGAKAIDYRAMYKNPGA